MILAYDIPCCMLERRKQDSKKDSKLQAYTEDESTCLSNYETLILLVVALGVLIAR